MRWSTPGAEQFIRKAVAPLVGLGVFIAETLQDEPRWLIVSAAIGLALGQPVARLLDGRRAPPDADQSPPPTGRNGSRSS